MEAWKHGDFVWSFFFLGGGWNDKSEYSSKRYIYIFQMDVNGSSFHNFWNSSNDLMLSQHLGPLISTLLAFHTSHIHQTLRCKEPSLQMPGVMQAPSSPSEKREPSHKYLGRLEVPAQRGRSQLPEGGVSSHGSRREFFYRGDLKGTGILPGFLTIQFLFGGILFYLFFSKHLKLKI